MQEKSSLKYFDAQSFIEAVIFLTLATVDEATLLNHYHFLPYHADTESQFLYK